MKLLAAGCSFVYGNELADQHGVEPSQQTFTALLARQLGMDYQSVAVPGTGSDSHVRCVVSACDKDVGMVVVAWSYSGRYEFYFEECGWTEINHVEGRVKQVRDAAYPLHRALFASLTDQYQWYTYVRDIVFLQNWLKSQGVPYIFCGIDPGFTAQACADPAYQALYSSIDWDPWFFWTVDGKNVGFRNWAEIMSISDPRFEISTQDQHPLEYAHSYTAQLLAEWMKTKRYKEIHYGT